MKKIILMSLILSLSLVFSQTYCAGDQISEAHQNDTHLVGAGTEDYDIGIDVVAPPAPFAPVQLDAYLPIQNEYVSRLLSDFRPLAESVTFRFNVRADVSGFSLSWDLSNLPTSFTMAQLKQVAPVSDQVIDMKTVSEKRL